jgi:hypothetical protein
MKMQMKKLFVRARTSIFNMERQTDYFRIGILAGTALGLGYGFYDVMHNYDLSFEEAITRCSKFIGNIANPEFWTLTKDTLIGYAIGGAVGGVIGGLVDKLNKNN